MKTRRNRAESAKTDQDHEPLSAEQIVFAEVVAATLVKTWARKCRERAGKATDDSSQGDPSGSGADQEKISVLPREIRGRSFGCFAQRDRAGGAG